jgi:predicted transcriptional regulator
MKYEKLQNQTNLHWYDLNDGRRLQRYQLSEMIYALFDGGKELIIPDVAKEIGIAEVTASHIIRSLCIKDLLVRRKTQRNTVYSKKIDCALATMFYPKTILDNFKVKNKISHKMDDGKNISYPQTVHHEYGCVNTIYEGGE